MRTMTRQLTQNNKSSDFFRRALIGLIIGLLLSSVISMFVGSKSVTVSIDNIDAEIIPLAVTEKVDSVEDHSELTSDFDKKAARYDFFAKNKLPLSAAQAGAIANQTPTLSIVVAGLGQQKSFTDKAVETLPKGTTIGMSSHATLTADLIEQMQNAGFELWMKVSAITLDRNHDKGAFALNPTRDFEYNMNLLADQIGTHNFYTGMVFSSQALVKRSGRLWDNIVADIFGQGYGVLDNDSGLVKPSLYFSGDFRAPYIQSNYMMTETMALKDFESLLNNVRKDTLEQGRYILSLSSLTPAHLDILSQWVDSLGQENITLVPLSAHAQL
jgi:polysaccharide deacetylase 2 family uncharacterized protein YibQ